MLLMSELKNWKGNRYKSHRNKLAIGLYELLTKAENEVTVEELEALLPKMVVNLETDCFIQGWKLM